MGNVRKTKFIKFALVMTFITSVFFLFLGFAATVLFPFFAAGALHRRRTQSPHPSSGFFPKHLKTLPQFRFRAARPQPQSQSSSSSSSSSPSPQTDCVVCLDSFREGQWCRKLPACDHVFHRRCLDTWLVKVSACPICRTRVRLDYGDTESVVDLDGEEEAKYLWNFNRNNNGLRVC
ncbi:RING-H2 finger protein ATL56-like [Pyrus ussuriensis x Pyrus communis]|uniref:RING-H2 finger protein ATL56-like n=1 Tax=Pyrus ussuriensis x Pyrus communis TaxID=2448454 RepID=A0A5N5HHC3_9ROSA|nr:RING-H2 finger protein ATL56-like [Pyrus ussuriensis x Pyrus communis]